MREISARLKRNTIAFLVRIRSARRTLHIYLFIWWQPVSPKKIHTPTQYPPKWLYPGSTCTFAFNNTLTYHQLRAEKFHKEALGPLVLEPDVSGDEACVLTGEDFRQGRTGADRRGRQSVRWGVTRGDRGDLPKPDLENCDGIHVDEETLPWCGLRNEDRWQYVCEHTGFVEIFRTKWTATLSTNYRGLSPVEDLAARDPSEHWYLSNEIYPDNIFPLYCCGCRYVVTDSTARDLAEVVRWLPMFGALEDAFIGVAITRLNYFVKITDMKVCFNMVHSIGFEESCRGLKSGFIFTQHMSCRMHFWNTKRSVPTMAHKYTQPSHKQVPSEIQLRLLHYLPDGKQSEMSENCLLQRKMFLVGNTQ